MTMPSGFGLCLESLLVIPSHKQKCDRLQQIKAGHLVCGKGLELCRSTNEQTLAAMNIALVESPQQFFRESNQVNMLQPLDTKTQPHRFDQRLLQPANVQLQ